MTHGWTEVLFYVMVFAMVVVAIFTILIQFAVIFDPAKAKVSKRKKTRLPPYVQALIPLVFMCGFSHLGACYYTLTSDVTTWASDVRATVVCFGWIPALVVAGFVYAHATRPRF